MGHLLTIPHRFYPDVYGQRHIPIHYLLLVGYDEERTRELSRIVAVTDLGAPG